MAPLVGKDYTSQRISPVINDLLKDDNSEVRLNSIQNLSKIAEVLFMDMLNAGFMTQLGALLKDAQWRVRMAAVEFIGHASIKFKKDCYTKHFESIFMGYLTNSAAAVRVEGIK
jgi:serine/threonine-protein phosphatase 2A regulatory subunit A